jgi:hypothetical protein
MREEGRGPADSARRLVRGSYDCAAADKPAGLEGYRRKKASINGEAAGEEARRT